jgi:hypothetical protein
VDLADAVRHVPIAKADAGTGAVYVEPELVALLREPKIAAAWSQPPGTSSFPDAPSD